MDPAILPFSDLSHPAFIFLRYAKQIELHAYRPKEKSWGAVDVVFAFIFGVPKGTALPLAQDPKFKLFVK
jgi:hypothetical protein